MLELCALTIYFQRGPSKGDDCAILVLGTKCLTSMLVQSIASVPTPLPRGVYPFAVSVSQLALLGLDIFPNITFRFLVRFNCEEFVKHMEE